MRWYLSSQSYPELREIDGFWVRQRLWRRAFVRALASGAFWRFAAGGLVVLAAAASGLWALERLVSLAPVPAALVRLAVIVGAILVWSMLCLTWGGDMMRPFMRAVSEIARSACPACGHRLTAQMHGDESTVRCPECGVEICRSIFDPPYRIPDEHLAWPRRNRRRRAAGRDGALKRRPRPRG